MRQGQGLTAQPPPLHNAHAAIGPGVYSQGVSGVQGRQTKKDARNAHAGSAVGPRAKGREERCTERG
jgi:hypothetical protein